MQSYKKIDSEVSLRRRQASDLSYGPLISTRRSPWKVRVYFDTKEISFKRPRAWGKDHWLHSPACTQPRHHSRSRKLTFFFFSPTVSNASQKITPTANFSFHRHQNTKGTLWTRWLFSQKLVRTSWNREDMEGLCTFSGSWLSQKHMSWARCGGVTQSN